MQAPADTQEDSEAVDVFSFISYTHHPSLDRKHSTASQEHGHLNPLEGSLL